MTSFLSEGRCGWGPLPQALILLLTTPMQIDPFLRMIPEALTHKLVSPPVLGRRVMTAGDWPCATPMGQGYHLHPQVRIPCWELLYLSRPCPWLLSKCPLGPWWPFLKDHCPRPAPRLGSGMM